MGKAKEHLCSLEDQPELTQQHSGLCRQQPLLQLLPCLAENINKSSVSSCTGLQIQVRMEELWKEG